MDFLVRTWTLHKVCRFSAEAQAYLLKYSAVRTTRARIIYLRNDYKALMNVIEKHIHEHFARLAEDGTTEDTMTNGVSTSLNGTSSPALNQVLGVPFAKVNSVVSGSPADSAGLKAGDEVRNFGYVNHTNHEGLRRVGECVQSSEGVSSHRLSLSKVLTTSQRDVLVKISRSSNGRRLELQLNLQPRRDWGGRGLLGCHILPL